MFRLVSNKTLQITLQTPVFAVKHYVVFDEEGYLGWVEEYRGKFSVSATSHLKGLSIADFDNALEVLVRVSHKRASSDFGKEEIPF